MKLSAAMADLAARDGNRNMRICNLCQADVSNGLSVCPECGAQLGAPRDVDPMSSNFDAELARANLLRMRGEFRAAEDLCLSVLKRFPNSVAAHSLLGDIYSDQGLLDQAAQWFELALDLDPTSPNDLQKIEDVREQIKERDHISSIEQLGLPESRQAPINKVGMLSGVAIVLLLVVIYAARHGKFAGVSEPAVVSTPIKATPDMVPVSTATNQTINKQLDNAQALPPVDNTVPVAPPANSSEDHDLFQLISDKSAMGSHLVSAMLDPRTKSLTLTYTSNVDEDERKIGAILAKSGLELSPDVPMVTIRSNRAGKLSYTADVSRSRLAETQTPEWQQKADSPDAWINYILQNEWPTKVNVDLGTNPPPQTSSGDSTLPTTTGQ